MIKGIKIENFKKFTSADVEIHNPVALFVGQNNGGKTTALQAISLWSFLINQWRQKKGGGTAKKRVGAPVIRTEIHPAPVLEIANLWTHSQVRKKGTTSENIKIKIILRGMSDRDGLEWEYGVEATFGNRELLYSNPIDVSREIPDEVGRIFHLPPLSGVQTEEPRIDLGAQFRAIGEGRPGEILRNLLLDLQSKSPSKWDSLVSATEEFFAVRILPIRYDSAVDPHISVYYQPIANQKRSSYKMEISSAGSGFLQFLLIAAFLLAHENSILLIDEPDSHMHVFLQRSIFEWLQRVALEEKSQIIISTHSEVLINTSSIESVVTFFGSQPKPLSSKSTGLIAALSEVSPLAIINAEWKKKIIFVEGESDRKMLIAWSEALNHPVRKRLAEAFFHPMGTNDINKTKKYFVAIQAVTEEKNEGLFLRDGIGNKTQDGSLPQGLRCEYWNLSEIENYLIHPESLVRFVENFGIGGLFGLPKGDEAKKYLDGHLSALYINNPHLNTSDLGNKKGTDFLTAFFKELKIEISKPEFWRIANMMKKTEIFPEVNEKLDVLEKFLS